MCHDMRESLVFLCSLYNNVHFYKLDNSKGTSLILHWVHTIEGLGTLTSPHCMCNCLNISLANCVFFFSQESTLFLKVMTDSWKLK